MPSQSDLVRITDRKNSVKTSGASAAATTTTATAGQLARPGDGRHAGLPNSPSGPHREHGHQQGEREQDRVVGQVGVAEDEVDVRVGVDQPERQRADGRAAERPHPADDHDDQRVEQERGVLAGRERDHRAAEHAAEPGQHGAEEERGREYELHVDPERRDHVAVVDAGTHDLARSGCG